MPPNPHRLKGETYKWHYALSTLKVSQLFSRNLVTPPGEKDQR